MREALVICFLLTLFAFLACDGGGHTLETDTEKETYVPDGGVQNEIEYKRDFLYTK